MVVCWLYHFENSFSYIPCLYFVGASFCICKDWCCAGFLVPKRNFTWVKHSCVISIWHITCMCTYWLCVFVGFCSPTCPTTSVNGFCTLPSCTYFLLAVGSELCSLDPPLGQGVDVETGVVVPDLTGVCGAASPIVSMGLNLVRLNPISIKVPLFLSLDSVSWQFILDSLCLKNSLWNICISLSAMSASPLAVCKITLIRSFSSSSHVSTYLSDGIYGSPSST